MPAADSLAQESSPDGAPRLRRAPVPLVLQQHVDDAADLWTTRTRLCAAPHVRLHHLRRFDDRLAAHLDALAIAGPHGKRLCEAALGAPAPAAVFTATVQALRGRDADWLERLLALAEAVPAAQDGVAAAFGWAEPEQLRGIAAELLRSPSAARRYLGLAACAMHRVDPGLGTSRLLNDTDARVRARAWRTAGELGRRDLGAAAAALSAEGDPACRFWAAWSAALLGDRGPAPQALAQIAAAPGAHQDEALALALQVLPLDAAHKLLQPLARDPAQIRRLVRGAGLVGDPTYLPWLIGHMTHDPLARLAGESFSLITGADLAALDLERKPPADFQSGPTDDPRDPSVDMDADDGLPWPDAARAQSWWSANAHRFPRGARYFMGEPPSRESCARVLAQGCQRQRIAAALLLALLHPGAPLFEWRAPAWRQQRALA
jgi:uncharacterized protein (TIGR02270 family)